LADAPANQRFNGDAGQALAGADFQDFPYGQHVRQRITVDDFLHFLSRPMSRRGVVHATGTNLDLYGDDLAALLS